MKRLVFMLAVCAASVVVASAAASTAKLEVTPTVPTVGGSFVLSGCGYTPGDSLEVQAVFDSKNATVIDQVGETVDSSGCLSTSDVPLTASYAGKWTANVFSFATGHKLATLNFTVAP